MKSVIHIALILCVGVGLGLTIRNMRARASKSGVPDGEVVYSNDQPFSDDPKDSANDEPTHPPEDEAWLSKFSLTERSGETVSTADLAGQPYVISFFFSTCPASCITQNQKIKELQDEFAGQGVRFIAISVDPETDTPEVLREYAARMGADKEQWLFMTGDMTYIRRVGAEIFQQPVDRKFHTDRFVLVDADGEIEGFYNWPERRQFAKLKERINDLLP